MKILTVLYFFLLFQSGYGQIVIRPYFLSVTFQMTTNIIFPYGIINADIGSGDIIGHLDEHLRNVLFLKAKRKNCAPTNLSVYTEDGKFYSFILTYKNSPDTLNLLFSSGPSLSPIVEYQNAARLDSDATNILNQSDFMHVRTVSQQMKARLKGVYIRDQMLWFKMEIANYSSIDFQPDYIKFTIRDKQKSNRSAQQETELTPSWSEPDSAVGGNGERVMLFAFTAFTLSPPKKLQIEIREKNGGRLLLLSIKNKKLLKARLTQ